MKRMYNDDRAVSETIGFILVFAIVLSCIAIILLFGTQALDNTKNQNNFQSIEQGFTVMQSDLQQIALEGAPMKTSKIHLADGTVFSNTSTGMVYVNYTANNTNIYGAPTGQIVYSSGHDLSLVSVENGGLWLHYNDPGTDVVVTEPRIYRVPQSDTLVINVIRLNATPLASGGPRTLNIQMSFNSASVKTVPLGSGADINLTYYTNYPHAWSKFFSGVTPVYTNAIVTNSLTNAGKTTAEFKNVKTLIISEHIVNVKFN